MTEVQYHANELAVDRGLVSAAALEVAAGLNSAGFDGYLVGGCVRDLLLRQRPKDFDITTNASPQQVKALFRRSRIIGRRFKIVHVRVNREVIEVATYRAKPGRARDGGGRRTVTHSGRVVDDNVFGTIEQDAVRRDFTINSLYYDPRRDVVLDFVGGVKDARRNTLRMIGDAHQRFTEDPVRMLRALRFRAKLGLELDAGLAPAIADCRRLLDDVPAARLYDEVLKMFHHGHAADGWRELRHHDLAARLFPLTAADTITDKLIGMALDNTDRRVRDGKPVIAAFLYAVLLWQPYQAELARGGGGGAERAADAVFRQQVRRVAVPRRVSEAVLEIWTMQSRLQRRKPGAVLDLLAARRFRAAYDFLVLRQRAGEGGCDAAAWWTEIQACEPAQRERMIERLRPPPAALAAGATASP